MLSSLWPWTFLAINPAMSFHCVCYNFVFLFISYYLVGLRADVPTVSTHFFINPLLRAFLVHFPRLYLFWACWPTFLPCQPVLPLYSLGFLGQFTSSTPLFTPMGLLLNSFGFLGHFTTSLPLITLLGFLAIKLAHWVYQFIPWASLTHLLLLYLLLFPWALYFIPWASSTHLLILYLFLFSWAYRPSILLL